MQEVLKHILLLLVITALGCYSKPHETKCLHVAQPQIGDTLVVGNMMDGIKIKDFNFVLATQKYLQGITEDSVQYKMRVNITTIIDTTKKKIESMVLKEDVSKDNFIDYISAVIDTTPIRSWDKSKPYLIDPMTGELIQVTSGLVIRKEVSHSFASDLIDKARAIKEWNKYEWEEKSSVNYSIELLEGNQKAYNSSCLSATPESVSRVLKSLGIEPIQND